ncbi:MAG: 1-acyl-sn-glycerol-3-phosphate acyltransferase [Phycisphaerales bacterium]|nr:1-acyl-sn-glycerol-3-phosphate acyltransferase [Phycisphaerales bacterium]
MTPLGLVVIFCVVAVLAALATLSALLVRNPRRDPMVGLLVALMKLFARFIQRARYEGRTHIPRSMHPGPLIVVSNHTAGADVPLIQAVCPFEIRWMMARSMQVEFLQWFWEWANVIGVDISGRDSAALREAIRHVDSGGVLGIFPEAGLERPPGMVMPFQPGIGLLIKKTGAKVLPVVVDGTPQVDPAWASLWRMGNARVRFFEPIDYAASGLSASEIVADLQKRYLEWTGWEFNELGLRFADQAGKRGQDGTPVDLSSARSLTIGG